MDISEFINKILGSRYFLDEVVIVGPYPSKNFFDKILNNTQNRRSQCAIPKITLAVDSGVAVQAVDEIWELMPKSSGKNRPKPLMSYVTTRNGQGIFHAKIYFFKITNLARNYTKQYLLLGSANASDGGFGKNAETYITIDFTDLDNKNKIKLDSYIDNIKSGDALAVNPCMLNLGKTSTINLPEICFVKKEEVGFDAWLRSGKLCHRYTPDQGFGKLKLSLKKALRKNKIETILSSSGFGQDYLSDEFAWPYVVGSDTKDDDKSVPWRGKYFIETFFGHWVSEGCFKKLSSEFHAPNESKRQDIINEIRSGNKKAEWLNRFNLSIQSVVSGIDPEYVSEYFDLSIDGELDKKYIERAKGKLESDSLTAKYPGFDERFVRGYSFVPVPQLEDQFEDFALDFCNSLLIKMRKPKKVSRIAKVVHSKLMSIPENQESLLNELRNNWSDPSFRRQIIDYYTYNVD